MNKGGTIKKLPNGKYMWVGYYKDDDGKIHRPSRTFKTLKEAEEHRKTEEERALIANKLKTGRDYTFKEYFELWKALTWRDETYYSFTTIDRWKSVFEKHILPFIGDHKIDNINYDALNLYFSKSELSRKSLGNIRQAIKAVLIFAEDDDLINSAETVKKLKIKRKGKNKQYKVYNILEEEDYFIIIDYMKKRNLYYSNAIEFLYETGLRVEELAFTEKDIVIKKGNVPSADHGYVYIHRCIKRTPGLNEKSVLCISEYLKSSSAIRNVPLSSNAIRAIERQLKYKKDHNVKSPYVFCSKVGTLIDERNMLTSFHSCVDKINEAGEHHVSKRGLHSLRKLFCKRMVDVVKVDWETLKEGMGHANSEITKNYYYTISKRDIMDLSYRMNMETPDIFDKIVGEDTMFEVDG